MRLPISSSTVVPMLRRAALLALTASVGASPTLSGQEQYSVQPGDQVQIEFFTAAGAELSEVAGTRIVDMGGAIFLPYVGTVSVAGLDAAGIRELLVEQYAGFYASPVVDVTVRLRVNILGSVRNPGHFFVDPTSTVIDAIATAGGFTPEIDYGGGGGSASDASQVRLVRGQDTEILDLRAESPQPEHFSILIQSGDWLYVPPQPRSRWRDEVTFWSSVTSLLLGIATLVVLITE